MLWSHPRLIFPGWSLGHNVENLPTFPTEGDSQQSPAASRSGVEAEGCSDPGKETDSTLAFPSSSTQTSASTLGLPLRPPPQPLRQDWKLNHFPSVSWILLSAQPEPLQQHHHQQHQSLRLAVAGVSLGWIVRRPSKCWRRSPRMDVWSCARLPSPTATPWPSECRRPGRRLTRMHSCLHEHHTVNRSYNWSICLSVDMWWRTTEWAPLNQGSSLNWTYQ